MNQAPKQKFLGPPMGIEEDGRGGRTREGTEGGKKVIVGLGLMMYKGGLRVALMKGRVGYTREGRAG